MDHYYFYNGLLFVSLLLQNGIISQSSMAVTAVATSNLKEQEQRQKLKHREKPTLKPIQPKSK